MYCEIALCQRNQTITNDGNDEIEVIFALDRSGSMTAPMFKVGCKTYHLVKQKLFATKKGRQGVHLLNHARTSDRVLHESGRCIFCCRCAVRDIVLTFQVYDKETQSVKQWQRLAARLLFNSKRDIKLCS